MNNSPKGAYWANIKNGPWSLDVSDPIPERVTIEIQMDSSVTVPESKWFPSHAAIAVHLDDVQAQTIKDVLDAWLHRHDEAPVDPGEDL